MSGIRKINPTNIDMLKHLYGIITSNNEANKNLTWDKFLECRDSVYVYVDDCYDSEYPIIDCILACRRTYMEEIDVEDIAYYCKPYHIIYSIECLYISNHHSADKMSDIICQMVDVATKDKNDAFICLKVKSCEDKCHKYICGLLAHEFKYIDYDRGVWTFIKAPTLRF